MEKHGIRARAAELQAQAAETFSLSRAAWLESFARIAKKAEEAEEAGEAGEAGGYAAARDSLRGVGLAMPKTAEAEMRGVLDRIKPCALAAAA